MIKTLLATMFVYLAGHSIKSLNLLKESAGITQKQWMDGDHQFPVSLMGPATEFPIAVYAIGTKPLKMPFGLGPSVTRPKLIHRATPCRTTGAELAHLRWKPPKVHLTFGGKI